MDNALKGESIGDVFISLTVVRVNFFVSVRLAMSISNRVRSFFFALLALSASSAFAQTVSVVEFYNKTLDAYFITGRISEQQTLDGLTDFRRTGMTFEAKAASATASSPGATRICRFYIDLPSPRSSTHFYGREGIDCDQLRAQNLAGFSYEGFDFAVAEPTGGVCPTGTSTVYRGFRAAANGKTANHRYTTSPETYIAAQNQGYVGESAAFCANASTDVLPAFETAQKCGSFYFANQRISYQSLTTDGTATSFQRFLNSRNGAFNGRTDSVAVVELSPGNRPLSTFILDGSTTWTLLGTSRIDDNGFDELYYANPTVYPRNFSAGQAVAVNSQLTYSRSNAFGTVMQTGKVTFVGKESVTVPLGTYLNACKFVTELVTTYSGNGQTTTSTATNWIADAVGIVKTMSDTETAVPSKPTVRVTATAEAVSVQPI